MNVPGKNIAGLHSEARYVCEADPAVRDHVGRYFCFMRFALQVSPFTSIRVTVKSPVEAFTSEPCGSAPVPASCWLAAGGFWSGVVIEFGTLVPCAAEAMSFGVMLVFLPATGWFAWSAFTA